MGGTDHRVALRHWILVRDMVSFCVPLNHRRSTISQREESHSTPHLLNYTLQVMSPSYAKELASLNFKWLF
jgi:hypothetical protein